MWPGPATYEVAGPNTFQAPAAYASISAPIRSLHVVRGERRGHGGAGQVGDAPLVEVEQVGGDLVVVVEGRREHRRVVGVDRHRDTGVDERPQRVVLDPVDRARRDVGGRAHLEHDPRLREVREQVGVLRGRAPVADALGPEQPDRLPDRLRAGRLPCVRHGVQARGARPVEVLGELCPRHADLRPAEPEADERVGAVLEGVLERRVRGRDAGLAGDVVDPAQHQAEVALGRDAARPRSPRCRRGCRARARPTCTAYRSARRSGGSGPRPSRAPPRRSAAGCPPACGRGRPRRGRRR